jgi:Fe-S-cluster containining protein
MSFKCSGCGICCTKVGEALKNKDKQDKPSQIELDNFPYSVKEDGSCEMLVEGKCKVYETRPTICNVEKMYDKHYSKEMTKNSLMKINNVPKEFYIKID